MAPNSPVPSISEETFQKWQLASKTPCLECPSLTDPPPSWVDKYRFRRGQEFVIKYRGSVSIGYLASAYMTFVVETVFNVLLNTRRFEYKPKCSKHLNSIKDRVLSWNFGDIWDPNDPAHGNMIEVQHLHKKAGIYANAHRHKLDTVTPNTSLEPRVHQECTMWSRIREDAKKVPQAEVQFQLPEKPFYMSQFDNMSGALGTIATILLNHNKLGIHGVTEKELADFVYMWRVLAYYLGVEDRFNVFSGGLEEVREVMWQYYYSVAIPSLKNMSKDGEFYFRVTAESTGLILGWFNFAFPTPEVLFIYGTSFIDADFSETYRTLTFFKKVQLWVLKVFFTIFCRIYIVRELFNKFMSLYQPSCE